MTKALTHIALHVKDVYASRDFYRDLAGMNVINQHDADKNGGQPVMWLASPGCEDKFVIVLIPGGSVKDEPENRGDLGHLGVSVASHDELVEVADQARVQGILYREFRHRASLHDEMCFVKDPDGNVVEFAYSNDRPRASKALTHLALHVKDVQACEDFYVRETALHEINRYETPRTPGQPVVWLANGGYEDTFALVLIPGGKELDKPLNRGDLGHLGVSVDSQEELLEIAAAAKESGNLHWDYQVHDYPVGKICAVRDPNDNVVEFSAGQPLGPDFKKWKQVSPCPPS